MRKHKICNKCRKRYFKIMQYGKERCANCLNDYQIERERLLTERDKK